MEYNDGVPTRSMPEFRAATFYERHTDVFITYWEDAPSYAERINSKLTLFRADSDDSVIGCEIANVKDGNGGIFQWIRT